MRSAYTIALLFITLTSVAQNDATHFKSDMDFGGGIVFTTYLDVATAQDKFTITSPKNADVRFVGSKGKAKLGRMMGKLPKKGILLTINGTQKADSLFGETKMPMLGKLKFRGTVKNNILSGEFLNADAESMGTLQGVNTAENKMEYTQLYPKLVKTIKDNIYSTSVLQTQGWRKFEKKLEQLCYVAHDDVELYFGFNILAQKLPFTHLNLLIAENFAGQEEDTASTHHSVVFETKNSSTAYLLIKNFSDSQKELASILPAIVSNPSFKNLIIDLRDNGGGGIDAAFELAKYIVTSDMEVGYFVTNKLNYSGYEPELFKTLPDLQPKSTEAFGEELKTSPGVKLIFKKPANPVFTGKIYVLTNGNTGSTCEPIVYALKSSKKGTIIGEKTYGGMLAASPFVASGKYLLMLPIADFYTHDGVRLDKVGVEPDIKVKSADAGNKVMEIINGINP